jgi:hypothetical protein
MNIINQRLINDQKLKEIELMKLVNEQQIEILKLKIQVAKEDYDGNRKEKLELNEMLQSVIKEYKVFFEGLTNKYDLPNDWGYDPLSGEIITKRE